MHMTFDQPTAPALGASQPASFSAKNYSIGELAHEFGLTLRALRFYEDRGLITPRREGASRVYTARDRARLSMIVKAKALGFTLSEIKETLAAESRKTEQDSLYLSRPQVDGQIAHLEQQRADIDAALAELKALRTKLLPICAA
jgi:DNA-binding transcriptional MerR regulator